MKKLVTLTAHAQARLRERDIDPRWIEETVLDPDWIEVEPKERGVERRFREISQFDGRVLRVVCVETESSIRVISMMFDRNARRKP